jgi:hypothetical protein
MAAWGGSLVDTMESSHSWTLDETRRRGRPEHADRVQYKKQMEDSEGEIVLRLKRRRVS